MRQAVKNYSSGFAGHEGNGMVGGRWWGCQRLGYKQIYWDEILDKIEEIVRGVPEFKAEAYFDVGSDESVGMPYYCDLDERLRPEDAFDDIDALPVSGLWKKALSALVEAYCNDIKAEDYILYDID